MGDNTANTDTKLIHRVRDGDIDAFRTLVDRYKDRSLSLAVSILKDETLAEDILQEVFLKVYKKIGTFRFQAKFSTWFYRIVVNTCYNELRKQKKNVAIATLEQNTLSHAPINDPLLEADQKRYIAMAMKQLKADEALVLRLFYLCEMSLKEIEKITRFKPSKIRVDLHRGRKNMQTILQQLLGTEINSLL